MQIRTAGDLRGFLADVMIGIRAGSVEASTATAISKVAAQINQSLATEINTALQLERMGKDRPIAGSMLIGRADGSNDATAAIAYDVDGLAWCEQCDARISAEDAATCKSKFCSLRPAQGMAARSDATGTGAAVGNSPVPNGDAPEGVRP